jgi:anti-sigma regulatory factor (Ser/Thr protein kinase)
MSAMVTERAWCVVVPHSAQGARLARKRITEQLADVVPPPLLANVRAVVAELVANAVRHARPLPGEVIQVTCQLRSGLDGDVVEIRVTDGGAVSLPQVRSAEPDATEGRGLSIVAALAARWGVERDSLGQSVWAEVS